VNSGACVLFHKLARFPSGNVRRTGANSYPRSGDWQVSEARMIQRDRENPMRPSKSAGELKQAATTLARNAAELKQLAASLEKRADELQRRSEVFLKRAEQIRVQERHRSDHLSSLLKRR
jgi:FtsZ-binding cell division protein ZapB